MIPPIFHLGWKSGGEQDQPPLTRRNLAAIHRLYPLHEIRIYDDRRQSEWAKRHFPEYVRDVFSRMPEFIMQVDAIRYMWMHIHGGIYCDTDVEFLRRIDFGDGAVFVEREWTHPRDDSISCSVHNCLMASEPGHPVWMHILEGIARNIASISSFARLKSRIRGKPLVFNATGPNAISKILSSNDAREKCGDFAVLPGNVLYQKGNSRQEREERNPAVIHHCAATWSKR